jgi:hypothetical protein
MRQMACGLDAFPPLHRAQGLRDTNIQRYATPSKEGIYMGGLIGNSWVVSLTSILITFAVTPGLQRAVDWMRSRRGALTGIYLALSQSGGPAMLRVETIRCHQIGYRLKGRIITRLDLALDSEREGKAVTLPTGQYKFSGTMHDRQVLLNYWSSSKASQNGGTMTMMLDPNGVAFHGIWCGTATNGEVISGPCMWIKGPTKTMRAMSNNQLARMADSILRSIENPWRKLDVSSVHTSKLRYLADVMDLMDAGADE